MSMRDGLYNAITIFFVIATITVVLLVASQLLTPVAISNNLPTLIPTIVVADAAAAGTTEAGPSADPSAVTVTAIPSAQQFIYATAAAIRTAVSQSLQGTLGGTRIGQAADIGNDAGDGTASPAPSIAPSRTITPTIDRTPSRTPTDTATPRDTPTRTPTPTRLPLTPTATDSPWLFAADLTQQGENDRNSMGCDWMGIGGQVYGLDGAPLASPLVVHVYSDDFDRRVTSGTNSIFGAVSGWEMAVAPEPAPGIVYVQVETVNRTPLSEPLLIRFDGSCDFNLAIVDFTQLRTP